MATRKVALLIGAIFLGYIGLSLLATGWNKHQQDSGSHLDLFIGGAVFALIALTAAAKAFDLLPGKSTGK